MTMPQSTIRPIVRGAATALLAAAAAFGVGCRGDRSDKPPRQFFPDMDDQPKVKPQTDSEFFSVDGRSMRRPVEGTVPFGYTYAVSDEPWAEPIMTARADLVELDPAVHRGVDENGEHVERIPLPVTREMIARGQERFEIYCTPCHGYFGDGRGLVGQRYAVQPANFIDARFFTPGEPVTKDGYLFDVIRNGLITRVEGQPDQIRMPAYGHALSERDAWAVVAYLRVLQEARTRTLEEVPAEQRRILEQNRPAVPPPDAAAQPETEPQAQPEGEASPGGQP